MSSSEQSNWGYASIATNRYAKPTGCCQGSLVMQVNKTGGEATLRYDSLLYLKSETWAVR
jgi:hypothetical protein